MYAISRTEPKHSALMQRVASPQSLYSAWRKVRANRGAAGIDAISIAQFEKNLEPNLTELSHNLRDKSYEPLPARYVSVPKPNGKLRELAIPTVRDRVAQRSVLDHIEPLFEPNFLDCSFGFRPGRSAEMAIQRIVLARARGLVWTVDADIKDCFPSIDHALLMTDLRRSLDNPAILELIKLWLDAGDLDGTRPTLMWMDRWRSRLAEVKLAAGDAVRGLLDDFVSSRLGAASSLYQAESAEAEYPDADSGVPSLSPSHRGSSLGRAALRRIVEDGALLAIAQRAAFTGAFAAKLLGFGGAALAVGLAAGPLLSKLKQRSQQSTSAGAAQGAPLSPLLSNVYLHAFDVTMINARLRLIRYADDFVVLCSSEGEATEALQTVGSALGERRLRLNPDKTGIVPPSKPFEFLGYRFEPDGRVVPPETLPDIVRRRVVEFARRQLARRKW
ncbi:MAG: reverse transcriptase domain-containing protein [Acidobacteriota bacterium]